MFRTLVALAAAVAVLALSAIASAGNPSSGFITDTLAPGGTAPVQSYRFITDTLAPGGGPAEVQAPAASAFDWGDAGIGAGVTAGLALALLGSARLLHRRNIVTV
jgi:hypothetical protein